MANAEVVDSTMSGRERSNKDVPSKITQVPKPCRWATKEDWIWHRPLIEELYGDRKLTEVAKMMESYHGFKATPSMYKKHLKVWGVTKYHNEREMRAIVHANGERIRQNKPVVFRPRGQVGNNQDVVRYWERKGMSLTDVLDQKFPSLIRKTQVNPPIPPCPKTAEGLAIPECILLKIRDYCVGSFESGSWISRLEDQDCVSKNMASHWAIPPHENFFYHCITTNDLLEVGYNEEAGRTLVAAAANIQDILFTEHPDTLRVIFHAVMSFSIHDKGEIAFAILRQFNALGSLSLGCEHPLPRICGWLASMKDQQTCDFLALCFQTLAHSFESVVGPMQLTTVRARIDLYRVTGLNHTRFTKWLRLLIDLLDLDDGLHDFDLRAIASLLSLAWYHLTSRNFLDALKLGETLVTRASGLISRAKILELNERRNFYAAAGFQIVAFAQYGLENRRSAMVTMRHAINLRVSWHKVYDPVARLWLLDFGQMLEADGQLEAAAEVKAEWMSMLDPNDML